MIAAAVVGGASLIGGKGSALGAMLGAFLMLGLQPGPAMMLEHADVVWAMIWTIVLSNLICVVLLGTMVGIAAYGAWRTRHTDHLDPQRLNVGGVLRDTAGAGLDRRAAVRVADRRRVRRHRLPGRPPGRPQTGAAASRG